MTAACVVGPNFKAPALPAVSTYDAKPVETTAATPGVPGGQAQRFVRGADIPADWWTLFHSKELNRLIEQALANNADLKAAQAALLVAHENTRAQRGAYLPQVGAGAAVTRQKDPSATLAPVPANNSSSYSLITPSVSVSYTPDVFGLNKRTGEGLAAQEQAARYERIATDRTRSPKAAQAAVAGASHEDQTSATNEL